MTLTPSYEVHTVSAKTDPDELAALGATLHHLDEAHRRYRNFVAAAEGLHPTDLSAVLAIEPGGLTPRDLGQNLGLASGTITALIDRLDAAGIVERHRSLRDRRSSTLSLTDDGTRLMSRLRKGYRTVLASTDAVAPMQSALLELAIITAALNTATHPHH